MKKFNLNGNALVSGGLILLGLAQAVLTNKKQTADINALEDKVAEKVIKKLSEKN